MDVDGTLASEDTTSFCCRYMSPGPSSCCRKILHHFAHNKDNPEPRSHIESEQYIHAAMKCLWISHRGKADLERFRTQTYPPSLALQHPLFSNPRLNIYPTGTQQRDLCDSGDIPMGPRFRPSSAPAAVWKLSEHVTLQPEVNLPLMTGLATEERNKNANHHLPATIVNLC